MKKFLAIALLIIATSVALSGCGGKVIDEKTISGVIVKIGRSVAASFDPEIKIACESADLNYDTRKVIVNNPSFFGIGGGGGWVAPAKIEGGKLILEIPSDCEYEIYIGNQRHILTGLAE